MRLFTFTFILLLIQFCTFGQNYILYHQTLNRVDEDILSENYNLALVRLDSIYTNYDFIYAQHCLKSLQICCFIDDSIRADKWLEKSFKQGIQLWLIKANGLTKKSFIELGAYVLLRFFI